MVLKKEDNCLSPVRWELPQSLHPVVQGQKEPVTLVNKAPKYFVVNIISSRSSVFTLL